MPVLNGYTASKMIRKLLPEKDQPWIIGAVYYDVVVFLITKV
jgi:hypothetical protein